MSFNRKSGRNKQMLLGGAGDRYLVFKLSNESYAVPITRIKECIALTDITPVPNTPPHFRGVMNLRGQMVSVVDMRMRLKMSKVQNTARTPIIIVDVPELSIGVIVDAIDRVVEVAPAEVLPPPVVENTVDTQFISGSIQKQDRTIFILNVEQALGVDALREKLKSKQVA